MKLSVPPEDTTPGPDGTRSSCALSYGVGSPVLGALQNLIRSSRLSEAQAVFPGGQRQLRKNTDLPRLQNGWNTGTALPECQVFGHELKLQVVGRVRR